MIALVNNEDKKLYKDYNVIEDINTFSLDVAMGSVPPQDIVVSDEYLEVIEFLRVNAFKVVLTSYQNKVEEQKIRELEEIEELRRLKEIKRKEMKAREIAEREQEQLRIQREKRELEELQRKKELEELRAQKEELLRQEELQRLEKIRQAEEKERLRIELEEAIAKEKEELRLIEESRTEKQRIEEENRELERKRLQDLADEEGERVAKLRTDEEARTKDKIASDKAEKLIEKQKTFNQQEDEKALKEDAANQERLRKNQKKLREKRRIENAKRLEEEEKKEDKATEKVEILEEPEIEQIEVIEKEEIEESEEELKKSWRFRLPSVFKKKNKKETAVEVNIMGDVSIDRSLLTVDLSNGKQFREYLISNNYITEEQCDVIDEKMRKEKTLGKDPKIIETARREGILDEETSAKCLTYATRTEIVNPDSLDMEHLANINKGLIKSGQEFIYTDINNESMTVTIGADYSTEVGLYQVENQFVNYRVFTQRFVEGVTSEIIDKIINMNK